jgi:hypothetical protein
LVTSSADVILTLDRSSTGNSLIDDNNMMMLTMMDTTNPYQLTIYKEPKLYTSVGTAYYTCRHHHQYLTSHTTATTTSTTSDSNPNQTVLSILCNIQITFYSSNTVTNQTTNTMQMQGILQLNTPNIYHPKNEMSTTSTITNMAVTGGTGIYHGANGQAIFNRTMTSTHAYKTIATFSVVPHLSSPKVQKSSSDVSNLDTRTINGSLPILDPITTTPSHPSDEFNAPQPIRIRRRVGHLHLQWTAQQLGPTPSTQPHPIHHQDVVQEQ